MYIYTYICAKLLQLCPTLCHLMDYMACQPLLSMRFSRQESWSGLPCPPLGDLPNPGMEPASLMSPVWQADSLSLSPQRSPIMCVCTYMSVYIYTHAYTYICMYIYIYMAWTSLVAQLVKNLPAMQEAQVQFLGWEDPVEKG